MTDYSHEPFKNQPSGFHVNLSSASNEPTGAGQHVIGPNLVLTLSINIDDQKNNPILKYENSVFNTLTTSPFLFSEILGLGIIIGTGIQLLIKRFKNRI